MGSTPTLGTGAPRHPGFTRRDKKIAHDWVEGGRHPNGRRSEAAGSGYKPQFFFRTTNVTEELNLPSGVEMVLPGENTSLEVCLDKAIALEIGNRFAVREGARRSARGW